MKLKNRLTNTKLLLILSVSYLMLQGCSTTVPLTMKFPEAPKSLMTPPPQLEPLKSNNVSDLLYNANDNYGKYYELKQRYLAWQEWYKSQKQIYSDIK